MPISVACGCGKRYAVDDSLAGKTIKCPACKAAVVVSTRELEVVFDVADTDAAEDSPGEFFMAGDVALFGSGGLYRVYVERDALLFLRVGTYFPLLGVEVGRKGHGGNWLGSLAETAGPVISGAVLVGGIILAIGLRLVLRAGENIGGVLDVLLVFGIMGLFFALLVLWFIRGSIKRAAALDAMTADERRAAGRGRRNQLLTADDIAEASIDKAAGGWGTDKVVPAKLTITLRPKGKRKLRLEHRRDVKAAARAIRRLIGKRNVAVNVPLKEQE